MTDEKIPQPFSGREFRQDRVKVILTQLAGSTARRGKRRERRIAFDFPFQPLLQGGGRGAGGGGGAPPRPPPPAPPLSAPAARQGQLKVRLRQRRGSPGTAPTRLRGLGGR